MKAFRKFIPHVITLLLAALLVVTQQAWAGPLTDRLTAPATATSHTTIAYQGFLTDTASQPVNATLTMVFRLYNAASGGTALWSETQNDIMVTSGQFSVLLGEVAAIPLDILANNQDLWLGITIGSDSEMTPREKLASAPYAMIANVPDDGITTAKLADGAVTDAKLANPLPRLLGHKTCTNCGNTTETGPGDAYYWVKGATAQDGIQVTATTHGRPIMVHVTARFNLNPTVEHYYCMIQVENMRSVHVAGHAIVPDRSIACSGSYLFDDLPAGTYTFRTVVYLGSATTVTWSAERQIAVYEF